MAEAIPSLAAALRKYSGTFCPGRGSDVISPPRPGMLMISQLAQSLLASQFPEIRVIQKQVVVKFSDPVIKFLRGPQPFRMSAPEMQSPGSDAVAAFSGVSFLPVSGSFILVLRFFAKKNHYNITLSKLLFFVTYHFHKRQVILLSNCIVFLNLNQ